VKKIVTRTITGLIFITIVVGSVCWSVYSFMLVFLAIALLGIYEFYGLSAHHKIKPQILSGLFLGACIFVSLSLFAHNDLEFKYVLLCLPLSAIIFIIELYRKKEHPFSNIAWTLLGVYYIAFPLALLNFFYYPFQAQEAFNPRILLGFFIITWSTDTVAYLVGSAFGKHKLFERISPGKTWEGYSGALIFGIIAAYILSLIFKDLLFYQWAVISLIIVVSGTFGDLAESLLKRSVHVKDSGTIMPGHGGILDRFDGVFFAAVFVYIYINIFITN